MELKCQEGFPHVDIAKKNQKMLSMGFSNFQSEKRKVLSYMILHLYIQFLLYRQKPLYVKNHYDFLLIYAFISFYSPLKTEHQPGDFELPSSYRSVNLSVTCAIKTSKEGCR